MKVFVSSTAYDLLDIRSELEVLLRETGFVPVMSDSRTAEFELHPNNSIETCLINLRSCDFIIVILDQRYGPSLVKAGFPDVSATHLEYNEAVSQKKKIFFYVRDRLEADYDIWRKAPENDRDQVQLTWVKDPKDRRLFGLLDGHRKLRCESDQSNWFMSFRNSVELKQLVSRDLRIPSNKIRLQQAIKSGQLPSLSIELEITEVYSTTVSVLSDSIQFEGKLRFMNTGAVPCQGVEWDFKMSPTSVFKNSSRPTVPFLMPGEKQSVGLKGNGSRKLLPKSCLLAVRYQMVDGHRVQDFYEFGIEDTLLSQGFHFDGMARLLNRQFASAVAESPTYRIGDDFEESSHDGWMPNFCGF